MTIKLYTYWRSSAAYRVRIALNLKGLDYETVPVSLAPGENEHRKDEYRAINPQMLVPFFDDGNVAINKNTGLFRTAYWGFGLEGIPAGADRDEALASFLEWCAELPADDGDSDGAANGLDCVPADPGVWSAPSAVETLIWSSGEAMNWGAPSVPGATVLTYDLLRSLDPADFTSASCIASDLGGTAATDSTIPLAGQPLHYLVRSVNACGSSLGVDSAGSGRPGTVCP